MSIERAGFISPKTFENLRPRDNAIEALNDQPQERLFSMCQFRRSAVDPVVAFTEIGIKVIVSISCKCPGLRMTPSRIEHHVQLLAENGAVDRNSSLGV